MAKNRVLDHGRNLALPVPEGTVSGSPVIVGQIPGVALIDRKSDGKATVQRDGTFKLAVVAKNKAGNSKVSVGDIIFMKGTELNKNNEEGVRYGYALEEVPSGETKTIEVAIGY